MVDELLEELDIERISPSLIMVVGVGGAGGNAVNHMFDLGIKDVAFMVCNTDKQALRLSPVPIQVQLGTGRGAGNMPEKGREAAIDSLDEITSVFKRECTEMVFITAGMGGGTGTGAAPVIAKAAKEMGILTVGIVTMPYKTEGPLREKNAIAGVEELKQNVDSLLIINNENIQEIYGKLPITQAFGRANDVLATAAKGIAEIITCPSFINVDFADVKKVMSDSGVAVMGSGRAGGEERAHKSAEVALSSPLLNHNSIVGATNILINITYGREEITMDDQTVILDYIQNMAGRNANIIYGVGCNDLLGSDVEVTVIATGFKFAQENMGNSYGYPSVPVVPIDETAAAMKRRWIPPTPTDGANPFAREARGSFSTGANVPQSSASITGRMGNGLGQNPKYGVQNLVVKLDDNGRYMDIEQMISIPAYIRRKVRLIKDTVEDRVTKISSKDSSAQQEKGAAGGSLFD